MHSLDAKNRIKGEMGKLDFIKMKNVCSPKAPAKMSYRPEKIFADHKVSKRTSVKANSPGRKWKTEVKRC